MSHITPKSKKISALLLENASEKEQFHSLILPDKKIRYIPSIKI